jgi:hypothetical protein
MFRTPEEVEGWANWVAIGVLEVLYGGLFPAHAGLGPPDRGGHDGRGEVETNDVVFRCDLACSPVGICSTSTWRLRPRVAISLSTQIGYR